MGLILASITVLFRPFLFEAHTLEAVVTSIEGSALLLFSAVRIRSFLSAARRFRETPYVVVAMVYVVGSIFALATIANFGILARQRTLLYPMFLVLMCFLPARDARRQVRGSNTPEPARVLTSGGVS
jgi:hypothetical protein